jgi:hypothetical protein
MPRAALCTARDSAQGRLQPAQAPHMPGYVVLSGREPGMELKTDTDVEAALADSESRFRCLVE